MIAADVSFSTEFQTEFCSIDQVELSDGRRLAYITFLNESDETIVGIAGQLTVLDENGRMIDRRRISFHNLNAKPREVSVLNLQLDGYPAFSDGHMTVESVSFLMPDGKLPNENHLIQEERPNMVTEEERAALSRIAGDAVRFPEQHGSYWICACGRQNPNEWNLCFGCNRIKYRVFREFGKEAVMTSYREQQRIESERLERSERVFGARRPGVAPPSIRTREEKFEKFERILVFTTVFVLVGALLLWGFALSQKSPNRPGENLTSTTFHHAPAIDYLDPV